MTTLNQAREAIYAAFVADWSVGPASAYTFDNEKFDPPEGAPWARLSVRHRGAGQETLGRPGARRFARRGAAFVQVFVPEDTGTADADSLTARARAIFEGVTLAGTTVRFQDVIVRETGVDGVWYGMMVEAIFEYDETK